VNVDHDAAEAAEIATHWVMIPTVAYDPDDGLGLGARAELDRLAPGFDPYRAAYVVHGYASTNGYHHHRFRFDRVGLGAAHDLRLTGHFAYRQWLNDGYWGTGNATTVERAYADVEDPDDPDRKRYRYTLIQPFGRLMLRKELAGDWAAFGVLLGKYTAVKTYPGSLLEEEQPFGMDGGFAAQLGGGLMHDTREPELTPSSGHLAEVAVRYTPPLSPGTGHFGGAFASARGFAQLAPKVVLGSRIMLDWIAGDIPFYDLITWGGSQPVIGFGGSETIRGVNFGRWRGPVKALSNTELRVEAGTHTVLHKELRWQFVPFLDVGEVWGTDGDAVLAPHPALGAGFHPIYDRTFAGRLDAAMGLDLVSEPDGAVAWEPSFGGYVVFEHIF
jgi:hypothetical protein